MIYEFTDLEMKVKKYVKTQIFRESSNDCYFFEMCRSFRHRSVFFNGMRVKK